MAITFDAYGAGPSPFVNGDTSWTHTPVDTPKGVVVVIVQEGGAADEITGVTYDGVAMARVRREVKAAAEAGQVYIYFLGSGLGTGAKTVAINATSEAVGDYSGASFTVTADAAETECPVTAAAQSASQANPSLAISPTAEAEIFYGLFSGLAAPITTNETNTVHRQGRDLGADCAMWASKSVAAGGSTTIGYTAAADDMVHAACAVQELAAAGQPTMMRWGGIHNMPRTSRQRRGW